VGLILCQSRAFYPRFSSPRDERFYPLRDSFACPRPGLQRWCIPAGEPPWCYVPLPSRLFFLRPQVALFFLFAADLFEPRPRLLPRRATLPPMFWWADFQGLPFQERTAQSRVPAPSLSLS